MQYVMLLQPGVQYGWYSLVHNLDGLPLHGVPRNEGLRYNERDGYILDVDGAMRTHCIHSDGSGMVHMDDSSSSEEDSSPSSKATNMGRAIQGPTTSRR